MLSEPQEKSFSRCIVCKLTRVILATNRTDGSTCENYGSTGEKVFPLELHETCNIVLDCNMFYIAGREKKREREKDVVSKLLLNLPVTYHAEDEYSSSDYLVSNFTLN